MLSGAYTNLYNMNGRSYQVIPQLKDSNRSNPEELNKTYKK